MFRSLSSRSTMLVWLVALAPFLLMSLVGLGQDDDLRVPYEYVYPTNELLGAVTWLGSFEGSWYEMGVQYGQRAAKDIRNAGDAEWFNGLGKFDNDPESIITLITAYEEQIYLLSPEMLDFMQGIADGAAPEMDKSVYAEQSSNYERVLNIQMDMLENTKFLDLITGETSASMTPEQEALYAYGADDCQGFWVTGPATADGKSYASRHSQGGSLGNKQANMVAFVLIPDDPRAAVTFVHCPAGDVGSGQELNEYGVYLGWGAASPSSFSRSGFNTEDWAAVGNPNYIFNLPAVVYAKTARDAVDYITHGTERYRRLTGRKTLLRARGLVEMCADPNEAFVVEFIADRYAVRPVGYLGETADSFLIWSNQMQYEDGSFDENDVFDPDIPMASFKPMSEGSSSYYRYWTEWYFFEENFGNITLDSLLYDLSAAHYARDKDGNYIAPDPETGLPVEGGVCVHGSFSEEWPLGTKYSFNVSVANLTDLEIYFIPGMPCQYVDHGWNVCNLRPYVEYRNAVYGY